MSSLLNLGVKQTTLPQNYSSMNMHGRMDLHVLWNVAVFLNMCTKIMCAGIQELERGKGEHNAFFILLTNKFSKSFLYLINPTK